MSDGFAWQPGPSGQRGSFSLRIVVVLAFATLGIVLGSLYPLKLVMNAFERATPPRVSPRVNVSAAFTDKPGSPASGIAATDEKPPSSGPGQAVILNAGSAEKRTPPAPEQEGVASVLPPARAEAQNRMKNHRPTPTQIHRPRERNVLVVVRRRGAPFDTKVLRGRIRDGRLIVNARGITLR